MVQLWLMEGERCEPLSLLDMSSLDSATRALPTGLYTTFRTYHSRTRVVGLQAHLDRLYEPSHRLGIQPVTNPDRLRLQLATLLEDFPSREARVRLILSTGAVQGAVYIAIEPLLLPPAQVYRNGVRVVTTSAHRDHPTLKTTAFIDQSQAERRQLVETGIYEGLMVRNGRILEGLTSNFFYVLGERLGTARRSVLNGVTRRQVIRLAEGQGIKIDYHALPIDRIHTIDEAFLTSSSRGVVPIVTINGKGIGRGGVGEYTRLLMKAYINDVEWRAEPIVSPALIKSPQSA